MLGKQAVIIAKEESLQDTDEPIRIGGNFELIMIE